MWNDKLNVHLHSASFHVILASVIHVASRRDFGIVCFYGDRYHRQIVEAKSGRSLDWVFLARLIGTMITETSALPRFGLSRRR